MRSIVFIPLVLCTALLAIEENQFWDGNQINNWWTNYGQITTHRQTGNPGMEWPAGSGDTPVYCAGLWVVAGQVNGVLEYRSAAAEFTGEYVPGPYGAEDPEHPDYRIYKIRAADGRANPDWDIWPVDQGAPWIDANEDGIYDPAIDSPDIKGDLYYWTVFNDGNEERHQWLWSTPPLGIEVRAACFGFDGPGPLENTLFFEWNIHNTGDNQLDSVFIGIWQDIDLGDATNDYPGCAPDLDLSYHYIGELPDRDYGYHPPAAGFTLLQGPIVPSPGDTALVSGDSIPDHRNLESIAFYPYYSGMEYQDPENAQEAFWTMNGRNHLNELYINPATGLPESMLFTGNPMTGEGWLAENETWPRDWRGILSTGGLNLAPGDSQQVVAAFVISPGMDPLAAVAALFDDVETVHGVYENQFSNLDNILELSEVDIPHNTESTGPFELTFKMNDAAFVGSFDFQLFYEVDGVIYNVLMSAVSDTSLVASIPDLEVTETSTLAYYIHGTNVSGDNYYWPSGAPYNKKLFTFGPDTDPPIVRGLQEHYDVHYLLPFQKSVMIDTVYDDRFGIHDIWLNWTIGGSDIMTAPMTAIDSNEVNWRPNTIYQGEMTDIGSQEGDTVRYWVTALDGSLNNLAGNSEIRTFVIRDQEIIGDLDHVAGIPDILDWEPFEQASMSSFNDGVSNWLNVILLAISAEGAPEDTMEMTRELDLTPFDQAWINIPMIASFRNEVNYGLIQIKAGGVYHTVDSLYGSIPPGTYSYDLSPFLEETDVSLRFIMNRGFGSMRWIIDDIVFHTDPELVGINEPKMLPSEFALAQNYPNPFNPETFVKYTLPVISDVTFELYDIRGRSLRLWEYNDHPPGDFELTWNGTDASGKLVSSGLYLLKMETKEFRSQIKMVYLR